MEKKRHLFNDGFYCCNTSLLPFIFSALHCFKNRRLVRRGSHSRQKGAEKNNTNKNSNRGKHFNAVCQSLNIVCIRKTRILIEHRFYQYFHHYPENCVCARYNGTDTLKRLSVKDIPPIRNSIVRHSFLDDQRVVPLLLVEHARYAL